MPASALPALRVVVGGVDYTYEAENLTWSNVDPGGYEVASFDVEAERADRINPGEKVVIFDGLQIAWLGRVAEPAKSIQHGWHVHRKIGVATTRISCEGAGSALKDNEMSMIYVDRDLSRWQDPSNTRQISLANGNTQLASSQIATDPASVSPALVQSILNSWVSPFHPQAESWYDSGPLNLISKIYYDVVCGVSVGGVAGFGEFVLLSDDQNTSHFVATANLNSALEQKGYLSGGPYRFGVLQHYSTTVPGGAQGATFNVYWHGVAAYGNHGLTGRGPDPVGFYTSDIAADAAYRAIRAGSDLKIGRIDTLSQYIVAHYPQYTPVPHEQIVADMARVAPAHYGTWESSSMFDETPEFTFRAYGTAPTVFTSLGDIDEADVSERLADLYTAANIKYSDAAGTQYIVSVTLPNAILDSVGITRTKDLDLGLSSTSAAQIFANFALQALFLQARSAGSVNMPKRVRLLSGGTQGSHLLKAGIDRIRIADLPFRQGFLNATSDADSFNISRVESSADTTSGEIQTRIEIDSGPNLLDTLSARLDIATQLASEGF